MNQREAVTEEERRRRERAGVRANEALVALLTVLSSHWDLPPDDPYLGMIRALGATLFELGSLSGAAGIDQE